MKVATILATKGTQVITVHPEQTIREALNLLVENNIGALIVVDQAGRLAGLLSERDIIRGAAKEENIFSQPVSELMTRSVIFAVPQDDLLAVAHTMTEKRFRHVPVLDKGELVGIVSIGDVVKAQRDQYEGEIDTLHTQLLAEEA